MATPKKVEAPSTVMPLERAAKKVQAFGDDAPLELDEVAAYWSVGLTSAAKIVAGLPSADPLARVRRWRYGDIRKQFAELVQAPA